MTWRCPTCGLLNLWWRNRCERCRWALPGWPPEDPQPIDDMIQQESGGVLGEGGR